MPSPSNLRRLIADSLKSNRIAEYSGVFAHVGAIWFVDSVNGSNNYDGKSFDTAFATITKAYASAAAGDTIAIQGTFNTEAAITCTKAGLRFIGIGTGPKQATWSSAADAVSLTINAANVEVANIRFQPPARSAGTPASIAFGTSASYAYIHHNRFQGKSTSYYAIYSSAVGTGIDNVRITDNEFLYMNTATYGSGIYCVESGGYSYSGWVIDNNDFKSCVTAIKLNGRECKVTNNRIWRQGVKSDASLGAVCTTMIDMYGSTGTSSGGNLVANNVCENGFSSTTLFKAGVTGDAWYNNFPEAQVDHGRAWFVDSTNGLDTHGGTSQADALLTIGAAVTAATAGDTIFLRGTGFSEAVTCTKAGLRFIGLGNQPNETIWTGAADAVCLTINAGQVEVANIKFRPPPYTAGIPAAIGLGTSGSYAYIHNCRFQGQATSWKAIYSAATGADNVRIIDNEFIYMNTATNGAAIQGLSVANAYSGWVIKGNRFTSCVVCIDLPLRCSLVRDNVLPENGNNASAALATVMTTGIHIDGNGSGGNVVTANLLGGTYNATLYKVGNAAGGADYWAGNFNVLDGGVTAANPA